MGTSDIDRAGSPLFTFVNENIFKKETFLGECMREGVEKYLWEFHSTTSDVVFNTQWS